MADYLTRIEEYVQQQAVACKEMVSDVGSTPIADVDELKEVVQLWSAASEKITRMSRISRNLGGLKKAYEGRILDFMRANNIEMINTANAVIQSTLATPRRRPGEARDCQTQAPPPQPKLKRMSFV